MILTLNHPGKIDRVGRWNGPWRGDRVVVIYREEHRTYACSLSPSGGKRELVQIADEGAVIGDRISYRSDEPGFVERLALPRSPDLTR